MIRARFLSFAFVLALAPSLMMESARADEASALREIAEKYADGAIDLDAARAAVEKTKGGAEALLKALRSSGPRAAYVPGESREQLEDDHGTSTDLFISAPSESDARASLKDGGLTTIVCLHGLGGNGRQFLPLAKRLGPKGRTLILAPTAQRVPQGCENDDVPFYDMAVPHWWLYKDSRSFPLEALRLMRRRYPIDPDRVILFGYSMGGFGTWNIGLRFIDRFAGLAPCAGGLSRREILTEKDEDARKLLVNARLAPMWFTHGNADEVVPVNLSRKLDAALKELDIAHDFEEIPGGHHILPIVTGAGNFDSLSKWMQQRKRASSPATVEFVSAGAYADGAFWLRAPRETSDKKVRLKGTIDREQNSIAVEVDGPASTVDVYLDDRLLDLAKPITVEVKGREPWRGIAKPSVEAILESWRTREDPKLVYAARVRFEVKKKFR